jgi:hypothetical protein
MEAIKRRSTFPAWCLRTTYIYIYVWHLCRPFTVIQERHYVCHRFRGTRSKNTTCFLPSRVVWFLTECWTQHASNMHYLQSRQKYLLHRMTLDLQKNLVMIESSSSTNLFMKSSLITVFGSWSTHTPWILSKAAMIGIPDKRENKRKKQNQ